ncbi:hypothetical protein [Streptomyces sp. NPDC006739]|uniref:hypothetical protein n=1 Tax=Streptomyces sp. NPDC006739 TaxID=3364763 RepID=UPI00368A277F
MIQQAVRQAVEIRPVIQQVRHPVADTGPARVALALQVAYDLHAPVPPPRAPEVTAPEMMGLRVAAGARPHRHKVPLKRLNPALG